MQVKKIQPLTKNEVENIILKFWKLNASKAHIADFIPILDKNFAIVLKEKGKKVISFQGLAGLQDHQDGKAPLFYNQKFILKSIKIRITNNTAIAKTTAEWHCLFCEKKSPKSKKLKAHLKHTWTIKKAGNNLPVITLHVCDYFKYLPGFSPKTAMGKKEFHLEL